MNNYILQYSYNCIKQIAENGVHEKLLRYKIYNILKINLNIFDDIGLTDDEIDNADINRCFMLCSNNDISNNKLINDKIVNDENVNDENVNDKIVNDKIVNDKIVNDKIASPKIIELTSRIYKLLQNDEYMYDNDKSLVTTINNILGRQELNIRKYSTLYKCKKCNKRQCIVIERQTRCIDEPLTLIVTCVCGHVFRG